MSLTSALSIAQSALLNTSRQTNVVSRNVSEANNPDYSRRVAVMVTAPNGAKVAQIQRATNDALFRQNLSALASYSGQKTIASAMDSLNTSVNGVENSNSAATLLGKFQQALQTYAATPSSDTIGESAVDAARAVVRGLNSGAAQIQSFRVEMDTQIQTGVSELNTLLSDFETINREIVVGTKRGADVNDALDQRDSILKKISEYVPLSVVPRDGNDMVLVTASGTMLFDTVARPVTFNPAVAHSAGVPGNPILVDGVPLQAGSGGNTTANGKLAAMVQLRENVAGTLQAQLDEVARGLITTFAESDVNGALPDMAGLFTWSGGPALPTAGTLVNGLAGSISINAAYDSTQGGSATLLRDGGANGADYVANQGGNAAFTGRLLVYQERLETPFTFDPSAGISSSASLTAYTASSVSWLEGMRQESSRAVENKSALVMRTGEALSNMTGVNIDEELSLLLDLEHTYEASARIMAAIDAMLANLLQTLR